MKNITSTPSLSSMILKINSMRHFLLSIVFLLLLYLIWVDRYLLPLKEQENVLVEKISTTQPIADFRSQKLFFEQQITEQQLKISQLNTSIDSMRPYFSEHVENQTLSKLRSLISQETLQLVYERKVDALIPAVKENAKPPVQDIRLLMLYGPQKQETEAVPQVVTTQLQLPKYIKGTEIEFLIAGEFSKIHDFIQKIVNLDGAKIIIKDPVMFAIKPTQKEEAKVGFSFKILIPVLGEKSE